MSSDPWVPSSQKGWYANIWLWVLGIVALVIALTLISWGFGWVFAGPKGALQARQEILSGANRIQAYNHFFDLCASVQKLEVSLDAQQAELATAIGDDRERIQANIAGITAERGGAIAQYNADARKSYTIGQFRSLALPYQLPTSEYVKGAPTSCVA